MKQYRNFVGDPYLECCGYNHAVEPVEESKQKKSKTLVAMGVTALMVLGIITVASYAYKKIAK